MIKIDFHIHTKPIEPWDSSFDFSIEKLRSYIEKNRLDCVAITNHNRFDKEQYEKIRSEIPGTVILPGIEIHVLNGHIIIVGSPKDVDEMVTVSDRLSTDLTRLEDYLSLDAFSNLIKDKHFIIIPHYAKSKSLAKSNIRKIGTEIYVGEVGSPKKFLSMLNDNDEELTPVIFSDLRCAEQDADRNIQETRYTYLKIDSADYNAIRDALKSKKNVSLSPFEDDTFDLMNGIVRGHKGINVVLGKRSTGKSFLLDNIYNSFSREGNILYIKQFELAKNSENNAFKTSIDESNKAEVKKYCSDINSLLLEIRDKNYDREDYDTEKYLSTLRDYADKSSLNNAFSKMSLFNYNKLDQLGKNHDCEMAQAIGILLDADNERKKVIEKYVSSTALINLLRIFIKRAKEFDYKDRTIQEANAIAKSISAQLANKSPIKPVLPISFAEVYEKVYAKNRTDNLLFNVGEHEIVDKLVSDKFHRRISIFKPNYGNKDRYREQTGQQRIDELKNPNSLFDVFVSKSAVFFSMIDDGELYSFFIGSSSSVTSDGKKELSGGEKAEYILINKLQNYDNYDIILIDEMESSFDNAYLNQFINKLIHEISKKCTVFISTHNNNLGVSLKPDYYIYHEYAFDDSGEHYLRFHGSSTSEWMKSADGESKRLSEVLLGTMEASIEAYDERRLKYEVFEN